MNFNDENGIIAKLYGHPWLTITLAAITLFVAKIILSGVGDLVARVVRELAQ
jgi:hypothetical protein